MEENIAIRLKLFMENRGLTSSQFADMCDIPRPTLSMILTGRNKKVSDTLLRQVHSRFPDLSISWLLFGEGMMYAISSSQAPVAACEDRENEKTTCETRQEDIYRNLNPVNDAENTLPDRMESRIADENKNMVSAVKIEKTEKKVTHITIYYDDSTFETFVPQEPRSMTRTTSSRK